MQSAAPSEVNCTHPPCATADIVPRPRPKTHYGRHPGRCSLLPGQTGADGAKGMGAIQKEGGITVGQDEASCTVYGMPRSAAEMGVVQRVVPLQQVPEQIMQITHYKRRA